MIIWGSVVLAFSIISEPPSRCAVKAFEIFGSCRGVKTVHVKCSEDNNMYRVDSVLVLDGEELHSNGFALEETRAYHVASAKALYAFQKHIRSEAQCLLQRSSCSSCSSSCSS